MNKRLFALIIICFSLFSVSAVAQDPITVKQLIGKWELTKGQGKAFDDASVGSTFTYALRGIFESTDVSSGQTATGTWVLGGKKLVIKLKNEAGEVKETMSYTIEKYDGKVLVMKLAEDDMTISMEKKE